MVYHMPNAHTDGDSIVLFRKSDAQRGRSLHAGSLPGDDLANSGSVQGLIDGLNRILEMAVAEISGGRDLRDSGHGRLCDEADVVSSTW
jgi:hypothetical protein